MRKFLTAVCCVALAYMGYILTNNNSTPGDTLFKQNTLAAATVPSYWEYNGQKPLDYILDQAKKLKTDTVRVEIHDTVQVNNIKYVRVPVPEHTTDTLYINMAELPDIEVSSVKNKSPGDMDSTSVELRDSTSILLIIDGKIVYSTKACDGLQEP